MVNIRNTLFTYLISVWNVLTALNYLYSMKTISCSPINQNPYIDFEIQPEEAQKELERLLIKHQNGSNLYDKASLLTKEQFISGTKPFLIRYRNNVLSKISNDLDSILENIYRSFESRDKKHLAVFTAHVIHNTSTFTIFEEEGVEMYKSRGLLMICGDTNYIDLDRISPFPLVSFTSNPEKLANIDRIAITVTIEWYESKKPTKNSIISFTDSMSILSPPEWTMWNINKTGCTNEDIARILNRIKIYDMLLNCY